MVSASDVAKYILSKYDENEGDLISNLKLQKLLYYCQGFHLAITDKALYNERIEHWDHGPVVPDVYHTYKQYGSSSIPLIEPFDCYINDESKEIIDEVLEIYGEFTASTLRNMTHTESPWIDSHDCEEISTDKLKAFFKTKVKC